MDKSDFTIFYMIKALPIPLAMILLSFQCLGGVEDEGGFHSFADYRAADPVQVHHVAYHDLDHLFNSADVSKRLMSVKRVRLVRASRNSESFRYKYGDLARTRSLHDGLLAQWTVKELSEREFRPVLALASDFRNYGDRTMCGFEPGVAVLIGDVEPEFVLICCFKCHDIHVVRRPTADQPMPQVAEVGMSPELERALFDLSRTAFPDDDELQAFELAKRMRSKTPITPTSLVPREDPFARSKPEPLKKR